MNYKTLKGEAMTIIMDGLTVPVVSIGHLKKLKELAGRVQDLLDIRSLEELKKSEN